MNFKQLLVGTIAAAVVIACNPWRQSSAAFAEQGQAGVSDGVLVPAKQKPLAVFHLGHSLVNRDMPAMLAQMAGPGHHYQSQLGWGTTLKAHWGDDTIHGFDLENANPHFRAAHDAVQSGDYDAIVMTEMVEIRSALRYHDSPGYLALWAAEAKAARPDVRLYLYETWHELDDPDGWLERLDADLSRYWVAGILQPALAELPPGTEIDLIPAGQALAAFVREVEARGGVGNVHDRTDLFRRNPDGTLDQIHLNDLGNYLVALVHYAVLYQTSPVGLSRALLRGDRSVADAPDPETALLMQQVAWMVVQNEPMTGIEP